MESYPFEDSATPARNTESKLRRADRRVAYTKMALRKALVSLMQDHHISRITVKSICEMADVNRSTFYLHYHDQYHLLHQIEQEVLETLIVRLASQPNTDPSAPISLEVMTEILEYARENADLARVLLSENCDFAFQQDIINLSQVVILGMDPVYNERTKDYLRLFGVSGCIAIAERWLKDGMLEQPSEIAQL
ncbi:MAG: TetR/AcrR family transcriptional regulator C-terminal domain-containing protein, partial [Coriobacteriales bacterium]|nr:TetR/AcrR family transcriptional regulator C-terminal domain-containing protein [Coriobacteriales bacterium]